MTSPGPPEAPDRPAQPAGADPGAVPHTGDDPGHDVGGEVGREVAGLARGGLLNVVGAAFSQLALFALTVVLARRLGKDVAGVYFQAFAFLSLLGLLSLSGFRSGLTRFVAVNLAEGDRPSMRGTVRLGLGISGPGSVLLAGGLYAAAPWLSAHAFDEPRLEGALRYVALALPATVFADAALSATQGFRTMKAYAIVGLLLEPALRLVLTVSLVLAGYGLRGAMLGLVASSWAGAVVSGLWLKKLMGISVGGARYQARRLFSYSMVSWVASLASTGLIWADTIILGLFRSSEEVARYNTSARLVTLATFVMVPIVASFAPRVADLHQRGQWALMARMYVLTTSWIVRLALPAFVVLLVFPRQALTLAFGGGFASAALVLQILAVGKIVDAATGPCGVALNMGGRVRANMADNVGVLLLNVALNLALIPRFGINGSAAAWAVSLIVVNVVRVIQVRRYMKMLPFGAGMLKGAVAAFIAAEWGITFAVTLNGSAAAAVVIPEAVFIGLVYVVVLLLLRLPEEDRMVLRSLLRPGRAAVTPAGGPPLAGRSGPERPLRAGSTGPRHLAARHRSP